MATPGRPIAFILASTDHGMMIINRNDVAERGGAIFGVGVEILNNGVYSPAEIDLGVSLLDARRRALGDGAVAIDCGANIGSHTIDWSRWMTGWGRVIAIEAQERVFYALSGNIAINNCMNARALNVAAGETDGEMQIPVLNPLARASFGSLELRQLAQTEDIGQQIDYRPEAMTTVKAIRLDSLGLDRLDLLKIDVEGMEIEVLRGAEQLLRAHKPPLMMEFMKSDRNGLMSFLGGLGYAVVRTDGMNLLAIHGDDPAKADIDQLVAQGG